MTWLISDRQRALFLNIKKNTLNLLSGLVTLIMHAHYDAKLTAQSLFMVWFIILTTLQKHTYWNQVYHNFFDYGTAKLQVIVATWYD